jgi:hypothetical protein
MKFEGYPEFGFDIEKIKNHLEKLSNISDEYAYLAVVNNSLQQAHQAGHKVPPAFLEWFNKTLPATSREFQLQQKKSDDYPLFNFNIEEIQEYFDKERNIANKCRFLLHLLWSSLTYVQQGKELPKAFDEALLLMVDTGTFNLNILWQQTSRAFAEAKQSIQEPTEQVEKIQWLGNDVDLAYLFELLIEKRLLPEEKKYKQIERHFINKRGEPFDNVKLSSNYSKVANGNDSKPKNASKIEEIVSKLKTRSKR